MTFRFVPKRLNLRKRRLQALRLVEEETRRYRPTKNYLEYLPAPPEAAFQVNIPPYVNQTLFLTVFSKGTLFWTVFNLFQNTYPV